MKLLHITIAFLPLLLAACGQLTADKAKAPETKPTIQLTLLPHEALSPGKSTTVLAKLNSIERRKTLTEADLETVHAMKFHLLIIDPKFTDYQHVHPQPTANPGVYSFTFTPKSADGYRAWANVTPTATKKQEFAMAELGNPKYTAIDKKESREASVSGYHFSLSFDKNPMADVESMGSIKITDAHGNPVKTLEPVMGAFGHIVGFYEDYRTILHTHPVSSAPDAELMFHLSPKKPGFIKLFLQVKIGGKELFVPFGIMVAKAS